MKAVSNLSPSYSSFVGYPASPKHFIVGQAPIPSTIGDFWRMIWEQGVGVIIVLCKEEEADPWWPEEGDEHIYSLVMGGAWMDSKSNLINKLGIGVWFITTFAKKKKFFLKFH